MKPKALDLFCGAVGASKGLADAGFEVWGVDIMPQPRYVHAGRFIQGDALNPPVDLKAFDFIWASPPCQNGSVGARRWKAIGYEYPDLIPQTRAILEGWGGIWCIENVPGADIRADIILTGGMFGLKTHRRRHFETSFYCLQPPMPRREGPKTTPGWVTVAGNGGDGPNRASAWADAMGIDWMDKATLRQAIPPAYSEYIGRWALKYIDAREAA
jgi:DNA (cytosine-5)-methyltransferase 1